MHSCTSDPSTSYEVQPGMLQRATDTGASRHPALPDPCAQWELSFFSSRKVTSEAKHTGAPEPTDSRTHTCARTR